MIRWGKVVDIHPEDNSVDLTMTDDGTHLAGVQVLSPSAGGRSGIADLPVPDAAEGDDKWDIRKKTESDIFAAVAYAESRYPVVLGFRYPQVNQVLSKDKGRRIDRHGSDFYETIDKEGNYELRHPSGTFLRIAKTPDSEDLTGKDADGNWAIDRNTDAAVHVRLQVKNGGAVKADIAIDPDGNVTVTNQGNLVFDTTGDTTMTAKNMTFNADKMTVNANFEQNGDTFVVNAETTFNGSVAANGGAFTHDGVDVGKGHKHKDVAAGTAVSGTPVS